MKPGSREWIERVEKIESEEDTQPESWWYLSFADEKFLGACVVRARGMLRAIQRAHELGINPGGQVMAIQGQSCDEEPPPLPIDRLLSKEELGPGKTVGELEREGKLPGSKVTFTD